MKEGDKQAVPRLKVNRGARSIVQGRCNGGEEREKGECEKVRETHLLEDTADVRSDQ